MKFKFVKINDCPDCLRKKYEESNDKITIFRLSPNNTCQEYDFLPYSELAKYKTFCNRKCMKDNLECCKCYGLSVETDKSWIEKRYKKMPELGNHIFVAIIDETKGKLILTSSHKWPKHASLFIYESVQICHLFKFDKTL